MEVKKVRRPDPETIKIKPRRRPEAGRDEALPSLHEDARRQRRRLDVGDVYRKSITSISCSFDEYGLGSCVIYLHAS